MATQPVCSLVPLLTKQIGLCSRVAHIIMFSCKCLASLVHCFPKRRLCWCGSDFMSLCHSFPQSAEGTRHWGTQCRAAGSGDSHPSHACAHGGWEHDVNALDQEDHRGGGPLSAAALPHPAARCSALQSMYRFGDAYFTKTIPSSVSSSPFSVVFLRFMLVVGTDVSTLFCFPITLYFSLSSQLFPFFLISSSTCTTLFRVVQYASSF